MFIEKYSGRLSLALLALPITIQLAMHRGDIAGSWCTPVGVNEPIQEQCVQKWAQRFTPPSN